MNCVLQSTNITAPPEPEGTSWTVRLALAVREKANDATSKPVLALHAVKCGKARGPRDALVDAIKAAQAAYTPAAATVNA
jgi:hypothetical protein